MITPSRISAIICTYRREKPLCNLLQTVLSQSVKDCEIVVVDQTPEHTRETAAFLNSHADRVRVIHQATPNLPMARNNGIRNTSGEFIIFVDDDLLLPSNCFRKLAALLEKGDFAGVSGMVSQGGTQTEVYQQYLKNYGCLATREITQGPFEVDHFIGALMAFRRGVFKSVGQFDENFGIVNSSCAGEDLEFCRRVKQKGGKLAIDPSLLVSHEIHHAGGCAAREGNLLEQQRRHLRANLYIAMKYSINPPRIDFRNWIAVLRSGVINREIVKSGPVEIIRRFRLLRKEHQGVQRLFLERFGS